VRKFVNVKKIFAEGESATDIFIIKVGMVDLLKKEEKGKHQINFGVLSEKSILGLEDFLYNNATYSYTALAKTVVKTRSVERSVL